MLLLLICLGYLHARPKIYGKSIEDMLNEAQNMADNGQYAEALRMVYDAQYQEERGLLSHAMTSDDLSFDPPKTEASSAGIQLIRSLIHIIDSPLMQRFRDPEVPIQEKRADINALRMFVLQERQNEEDVVFQDTYRGPFIQLLANRLLSAEEKLDVLFWIEATLQDRYTSESQKQRIRNDIIQLQKLADQRLQEHQYVEAFILMTEAKQKAFDIDFSGVDSLSKQFAHMYDVLLQADQSPLIDVFNDPQMPPEEKHQVWSALWSHTASHKEEAFVFEGTTYNGLLVQVLSHSKIDEMTKLSILKKIERMIKEEEDSYTITIPARQSE
jgi:hypothetical protein